MGKNLCKGYLKDGFKDDDHGIATASWEVLFAVLPTGEVYKTDEIDTTDAPNYKFDTCGRTWTRIEELPEGVEFIGNYEVPRLLQG